MYLAYLFCRSFCKLFEIISGHLFNNLLSFRIHLLFFKNVLANWIKNNIQFGGEFASRLCAAFAEDLWPGAPRRACISSADSPAPILWSAASWNPCQSSQSAGPRPRQVVPWKASMACETSSSSTYSCPFLRTPTKPTVLIFLPLCLPSTVSLHYHYLVSSIYSLFFFLKTVSNHIRLFRLW